MRVCRSYSNYQIVRGYIFSLLFTSFLAMSCTRNSTQTWEDVKTAGRYLQKGVDAICGKDYESRMFTSSEEFSSPSDNEFIPLNDSDLKKTVVDIALPPPKESLGEKGTPALHQFRSPRDFAFRTLFFETDDHVLKDKQDLHAIAAIATHLKKQKKAFLLIEGHTDERASASYNLALGMRRANQVRSLLIKQGVDPNRVYTISIGKERPASPGHTAEDWKQNRRAEFKLFEQ